MKRAPEEGDAEYPAGFGKRAQDGTRGEGQPQPAFPKDRHHTGFRRLLPARSTRAPPAAGMEREKEHRRRMARRARERRDSARDEPPAVARRGCRR